ncbi:molybdopterin-dependent oxidoreductase [Patulibacter sp. NPDC049589]|uniref:molybdopterin-dependent oxidoreductase n=1 Tax=Patulibacter sp. NPDC049589 TaxID=3154731 RepID=UPI00344504FC
MFTPTASFYETDVTFPVPLLDARTWCLEIAGLVQRPLTLQFDELVDAGVEEFDATLVCVHNPVGGPRIGTARWLGVPASRLLEQAGVLDDADQLLAPAVDGFTAGVPLATLRDHRAFVVVGVNGELLPPDHGHPARLLVPGLYGYDANTKWLTKLELTRFRDVADYWTRRGWPADPAHVRPGARIDTPKPRVSVLSGRATVAGVPWAPPTGVRAVDLSIDDGPWQPTVLTRALHSDAWRQWRIDVDLAPGAHALAARPRTSDDVVSPRVEPPYPNGRRVCTASRSMRSELRISRCGRCERWWPSRANACSLLATASEHGVAAALGMHGVRDPDRGSRGSCALHGEQSRYFSKMPTTPSRPRPSINWRVCDAR